MNDEYEAGYKQGSTALSRGWFVMTLVIWTSLGFAGGIAAPKWFPFVAQWLDLDVKELHPDGYTYPD